MARSFDPRALAARVLSSVVSDGVSLREALIPAQAKLDDPRDRALLTALVNEGARWWLRFDPALDVLLERPLRQREPVVHALLVLGLVQIEILRLPQHAAVAATVEAARALQRAPFANLVNAVLRRWLRERETITATLDADPVTRHACPRWLIDAIERDWPSQAGAILAACNAPSPPMLRVNRRRATRDGILAVLAEAGIPARSDPRLPDALALERHANVASLPAFRQGLVSVQDGAAQLTADLLEARDGMRVLDACAAPGGKACHLLERADVRLMALERDAVRAERIRENLHRLGLACEVRVGDAGEPSAWWDGVPYERILLDAPCSATGVIRRHPDIKLHRRADDIEALARGQSRLLRGLWPLLKPGGRLLYATCSLLRAENEGIVAAFLAERGDAEALPMALDIGHPAGAGRQILPGEEGLDGMYHASIRKRA